MLAFGEHLSRNFILPRLAPRVDGTSHTISIEAFHVLQNIDAKLCNALGCLDRPVSDFDAWKITTATLSLENVRDGLKSGLDQSLLQIEIQNRLAIPVLPSNLEIAFTDAEEAEIKSLQFNPQEWIPKSLLQAHPDFLKQGIPSGKLLPVELTISLPPNAAGYRVRVFYP